MVIIDIDGVLADLEGAMVEYLRQNFGDDALTNRNLYNIDERYADFPEILDAALKFVLDPNSYYPLKPLQSGLVFVERLMANGYPVQFLSSRPTAAQEYTVRWLKKHLSDYKSTLGAQCLGKNKTRLILKDYSGLVDFVVDDNPRTVTTLNAGGILAYSWAQPWNEGVHPAILHENNQYLIAEDSYGKLIDFWSRWKHA